MKKMLSLFFLVFFYMVSCDERIVTLSITQDSPIRIGQNTQSVTFEIMSNSIWNISSDSTWCTVPRRGLGNRSVSVSILVNLEEDERVATISITNPDAKTVFVKIVQSGVSSSSSGGTPLIPSEPIVPDEPEAPDLSSIIPIVFHILYNDTGNRYHYVDGGRIGEIVTAVNKLLNDNGANIALQLVTRNSSGVTLSEPGVNRIRWPRPVMDCSKFMSSNNSATENSENLALLWDPDEYINVFVYEFTNNGVLGVSHLPYTTSQNPLEGLNKVPSYIDRSDVTYPHSLSINNKYIYIQDSIDSHETADVVVTFTHELGHYLGLFHAFSEDGTNTSHWADDYCTDTKTYNRSYYESGLGSSVFLTPFRQLVKRTGPFGTEFISYNIMDYYFSYSNKFTPDQIARMHHVINYSPLMPSSTTTGSMTRMARRIGEVVDLPVRVIE